SHEGPLDASLGIGGSRQARDGDRDRNASKHCFHAPLLWLVGNTTCGRGRRSICGSATHDGLTGRPDATMNVTYTIMALRFTKKGSQAMHNDNHVAPSGPPAGRARF